MYLFPRAKFVDEIDIEDQIKHLGSEIIEARVAYATPYIVRLAEELFDVIHSAETALRILSEKCGCDASLPGATRFNRTSALPLYSQVRRLSACLDLVCQEFLTGSEVRTAIALFGVISTAECALLTLGMGYSVGIGTVRRDVIKKNAERGYYVGCGDVWGPVAVALGMIYAFWCRPTKGGAGVHRPCLARYAISR